MASIMRIWDISPDKLCRNHLLGEHSELHAIWVILTKGKNGFSNHPETLRWKNKLKALYLKHEIIVKEMKKKLDSSDFLLIRTWEKPKAIAESKADTIPNILI